jgi:hypothetical protein
MTNDLERGKFWVDFIRQRCPFPSSEKLAAQFRAATLPEFCQCGCNSFKVTVPAEASIAPIAKPGGSGAVFESSFHLPGSNKTLEIILFANEQGNLSYVEVDYCGNSSPVPEVIQISEPPYHVYSSSALAP